MSLWRRMANVFSGAERMHREIEEELESHIDEATAAGRDPQEARRAFGSPLAQREKSRDIRIVPWLESLYADAVFGGRQLRKRKLTSAAAMVSLGLAIGSCAAAFRLMDAMLWRPLPIAAPERLYVLLREYPDANGKMSVGDAFSYPMFRQMRAAVRDQAELIAISVANRVDVSYGSEEETEKANQQYISGWMFQQFGIRAAAGRVFTENDDLTPGAHPVAVLSADYWKRRFGADPRVVGRSFRTGNEVYQIVGVADGPFTGTEPGTVTDIFVPTMMMKNNAIVRSDYQWFRTFVQMKPGASAAVVREKLRPVFRAGVEERARETRGIPRREMEGFLSQRLEMNPTPAGVSGVQRAYRTPLAVLAALVMLVLLISCANVANLMTAQAAARQRELALRVSIGAGRMRLVQLVVVECVWLALFASILGACLAWWAAPLVAARIGSPDNPGRLVMQADWRVLSAGAAMALGCTLLFGLGPALRAAAVKPASALKGGSPHTRPRLMQLLIAAQVAFCVLVLFLAGLFLATSGRLMQQRTGFSAERLLTLETVTARPIPEQAWLQVADRLREVPGVEEVAVCEWPLMAGGSWNGFISVNGGQPGPVASYFLSVSPEWRALMRIPLLQGRDFRAGDRQPGSALVNEAFVRQFFGGESATGKAFDVVSASGRRMRYQVVGVVGDARYRNMREPMQPTAYFPFNANYARATYMVRTSAPNPMAMASTLRREVPRARGGFRVSTILTQAALIERETGRERLLSNLALFFGVVALLLAGVGLYGVLDYSVLQRRREIGIRVAVGAQASDIAGRILAEVCVVVACGSLAGIAAGIASARFVEALLFEVKATDAGMVALPAVTIAVVALVAAVPAILRAVRIDPASMLRAE